MYTFTIYLEPADTDEPRRMIGSLLADTMADALEQASQYYEVPSHDLVAEQVEPYYCGMCGQLRDVSHFPHEMN